MPGRSIIGIVLMALTTNVATAYDLGQHEWQQRLVFLIAPSGDDPGIAMQRQWLQRRWEALTDRDILVFQLFLDQGLVGDRALTTQEVTELRNQLAVTAQDRSAILIGKDGGIKRRAALNSDLREILLQIDAMPMRRDEIRAKTAAGGGVTVP